jgi:hypothetical protein
VIVQMALRAGSYGAKRQSDDAAHGLKEPHSL